MLVQEQEAEQRLAMSQGFGMMYGGMHAPMPSMQFGAQYPMPFPHQHGRPRKPSPETPIPDMQYFPAGHASQRPMIGKGQSAVGCPWTQGAPSDASIPGLDSTEGDPNAASSSNQMVQFGQFGFGQASAFKPGGRGHQLGAPQAPAFRPGLPKGLAPSPESARSASPSGSPPPSEAVVLEAEVTAESAEEASFRALKARERKKKDAKKKPAAAKASEACEEDDGSSEEEEECDEGEDGQSDDSDMSAKAPAMKIKGKPAATRPLVSILKRPASAPKAASAPKVVIKYSIPQVTKKTLKNTTWKIWGSNAYHQAKRTALKAGYSEADALAAGRMYHGLAGDKWVGVGGSKSPK